MLLGAAILMRLRGRAGGQAVRRFRNGAVVTIFGLGPKGPFEGRGVIRGACRRPNYFRVIFAGENVCRIRLVLPDWQEDPDRCLRMLVAFWQASAAPPAHRGILSHPSKWRCVLDAIAFTTPVSQPDLTLCGLCRARLPITPGGRRVVVAFLDECGLCGAPKFDKPIPAQPRDGGKCSGPIAGS